MSDTTTPGENIPISKLGDGGLLCLQTFHERYASVIADWVRTSDQLKRLAPGTPEPLTREKVVAWHRPDGHPFVLMRDGEETPIGYAELNAMTRDPGHFWLGHVIVAPAERGKGLGTVLVRGLVEYAFSRLGGRRISLIVLPENTSAIACYRRVGFVPIRDEFHDFGAGRNSMRMLRLEVSVADRR